MGNGTGASDVLATATGIVGRAVRMNDGPLPSWNNGAAKSAILDFVGRVTNAGGAEFVRPAERIAVFDNDGTLWCEQPMQVQLFFAQDRLEELAEKDHSM